MDDNRVSLKRPSKAIWIIPVVAAVGGAGLIWWLQRKPADHPAAAAPPPALAAAQAPDAGVAEPGAEQQPVAAVGPNQQRGLLEAVSSDPTFRSWITQGDAIRRWAVVTDNVAEGVSPRKQLAFLAPKGAFTVVKKGEATFIDPASYGRYDAVAAVVASVDAQAVANAYRALHGLLETAYRALGYPGASFDRVTAKALHRIEAAPVVDGDVQVQGDRGLFVFADPKLEQQGEIEKQLLRMGPRNARTVIAKAREIDRALGLPPPTAQR
jgi:hypothetical protein